jgi:hypothetical protein
VFQKETRRHRRTSRLQKLYDIKTSIINKHNNQSCLPELGRITSNVDKI